MKKCNCINNERGDYTISINIQMDQHDIDMLAANYDYMDVVTEKTHGQLLNEHNAMIQSIYRFIALKNGVDTILTDLKAEVNGDTLCFFGNKFASDNNDVVF